MLAGEDTKGIETLARYKTPGDFWKAHSELRTKLSERPAVARLPDNATPEQIGEYRKGLGLPEIAADAKPEAFMDAYGIKLPEGYEASEVEKGMVGDFAKLAYEQGGSPREIKQAVDFFFQQQQAVMQAANTRAVELRQEWQQSLKNELGRDYDATLASAESYLKQTFGDDLPNLLGAQLPGGGYLGDHPAFFKMAADLALQNGFGDRIETNALEAGGKSLAQQHHEIEQLRMSDPARYNAPEVQAKLDKLIELRLKAGEIDEMGNEKRRRSAA